MVKVIATRTLYLTLTLSSSSEAWASGCCTTLAVLGSTCVQYRWFFAPQNCSIFSAAREDPSPLGFAHGAQRRLEGANFCANDSRGAAGAGGSSALAHYFVRGF